MEKKIKEASIQLHYALVLDALKQSNFIKSRAAELLKIDRKTLYNILQRHKDLETQKAAQTKAA